MLHWTWPSSCTNIGLANGAALGAGASAAAAADRITATSAAEAMTHQSPRLQRSPAQWEAALPTATCKTMGSAYSLRTRCRVASGAMPYSANVRPPSSCLPAQLQAAPHSMAMSCIKSWAPGFVRHSRQLLLVDFNAFRVVDLLHDLLHPGSRHSSRQESQLACCTPLHLNAHVDSCCALTVKVLPAASIAHACALSTT